MTILTAQQLRLSEQLFSFHDLRKRRTGSSLNVCAKDAINSFLSSNVG